MNKLMLNTIALDGSNVIVKKKGGAGGSSMPIVATEEELQALNLPVGSIASIGYTGVEEISIRNLYQPTLADIDINTFSLVNPDALNVISQLKFSFPQEEIFYSDDVYFTIVPKDISINKTIIVRWAKDNNNDDYDMIIRCHWRTEDGPGVKPLSYDIANFTDGSWVINQEGIDALHDLLENGEWIYFGTELHRDTPLTEEEFDILDKFCVAISNVTKADAYIKADTWQKLVKQDNIANISNKMAIISANGTTLSPSVNTYYNFASEVNTLDVTLPSVTDATHINNIVFMLTTGSAPSVTFTAPTGINVITQDGFRIDASTTYEINAIFNGVAWVIASIKLNTEEK